MSFYRGYWQRSPPAQSHLSVAQGTPARTLQPDKTQSRDAPSLLLVEIVDIVEAVNQGQHVMLIGPDGTGKSSIAKEVMDNSSLVLDFEVRLFITYDDITPSPMTYQLFLDRIGHALDLPQETKITSMAILQRLNSISALLVIDNAETLLNASDVDAIHIAQMFDDIGALESTRLIIATRDPRIVSADFYCKSAILDNMPEEAS